LVIPDPHAHYQHDNNRAVWIGQLIHDIKPDVVVVGGDLWDMPSLCGYDRGKKTFQGRTYRQDIEAGLDFNEKLWSACRKAKKKMPYRVFEEGNHEERISRAINLQPELEGAIGFNDLDLGRDYDDVVRYQGNTPGVIDIDGILYAHYFVSGIMGRPVGGEHPGYSLVGKLGTSATAFHSHLLDFCTRRGVGKTRMGLVAGCAFDYDADWAGECNKMYWRGVVIKNSVENGTYDPQFVSLDALKREYGYLTGDV
jgi:hypothetical protein